MECEVRVDEMHLEHVSEFKYLGFFFMKQCHRKVESGRRILGIIRSLVNARGLQLEFSRVLHELYLFIFIVLQQVPTTGISKRWQN